MRKVFIPGIDGVVVAQFLDAQELVVLGDAVCGRVRRS